MQRIDSRQTGLYSPRMPTNDAVPLSARERLLAAADELFYAEGVHTVGIDRVIERAGVAKATLYSAFGSKDGLIRAYLTRRQQTMSDRMARQVARYDAPRDRLLAVFESLGRSFTLPGFRGCPFINATVEDPPGGAAQQPSDAFRASIRALFTEQAEAAGAADPERLAGQLALLYDGAIVGARMDRNPDAGAAACDIAAVLIDAAIDGRRRSTRTRRAADGPQVTSTP